MARAYVTTQVDALYIGLNDTFIKYFKVSPVLMNQ